MKNTMFYGKVSSFKHDGLYRPDSQNIAYSSRIVQYLAEN